MTYREQFLRIMNYEEVETMPAVYWGGWPETYTRWYSEGLPEERSTHIPFFGAEADCLWGHTLCGVFGGPFAENLIDFGEETLEETADYRIYRDRFGVILKELNGQSNIPLHLGYTFTTAADWPRYKAMLQRDPAKIPTANLEAQIAHAEASGHPITIYTGSLMGWARNWLGVENLSYLCYDDRECFADMVDTIADLACWNIDLIMERLTMPCDLGFGWEDICGRSGPLVSPQIFADCVAPGYRKIRSKLEEYGVSLFAMDSDGDISQLIGPWLEAGVNVQFPVEYGAFRQDATVYRKQYGKELRMLGNFDKIALERGPQAVEEEIARLTPLLHDGGFIMHLDHSPTPNVSVKTYQAYFQRVKEIRL
ncbi:MAG TPA: uroporphyrinogen decarboxylase family protein [Armatimonadota bacterium]